MNDYCLAVCPICNNDTLEEGEYIDVGVPGCGMKCSPDGCQRCGYVEVGNYADPERMDAAISWNRIVAKCWELQVEPHP